MPNKRVLIVEDEMLIALDLEMHLQGRGFDTVVATSLEEAMPLVAGVDLAILDFHVGGSDTAPIARALREHKKPFVVSSGSQLEELGVAFEGVPKLGKPHRESDLDAAIDTLLGSNM